MERLLHRLAKPLPEPSWIESEEFLVENTNCVVVIRHRVLGRLLGSSIDCQKGQPQA